MLKKFKDFIKIIDEDTLLTPDDLDKDDEFIDIDIELEDENGNSLDDDGEELDTDERARPPKLKKKQREANIVKSTVTKRLLGAESPLRSQIEKIFNIVQREIRKEATKKGVPITNINLDKLTIKR